MKSILIVIVATVIMGAVLCFGQKVPQTPKPDPEVAKLAYFVGDWKLDADVKFKRAPGEKFVTTTHNEWLAGGFFLVGQAEESSATNGKTLTIFGYDHDQKTYTSYAFNSIGQIEMAKGVLEENKWVWTTEHKLQGQVFRTRLLIEMLSPTSYKFKSEMVIERDQWSTILEGTATKIK